MNDRFIRLSISLARLQKVIQRIKASGMSRIELKAGHTLVLCRLAAAPEGPALFGADRTVRSGPGHDLPRAGRTGAQRSGGKSAPRAASTMPSTC